VCSTNTFFFYIYIIEMDIAETKQGIDEEIRKFVNVLKLDNSPVVQLGTSSFKTQQYFSDYDLLSPITNRKLSAEKICAELRRILKSITEMDDIWFVELKIQNKDGSKEKFFPADITPLNCDKVDKAIKTIDYIKIDAVIFIRATSKLTELSIIYAFQDVPPDEVLIQTISEDYKHYKSIGNIYKSLKRLFSVYRLEGDKENMVKLSSLFNSEAGKLYSLSSNLKAVKLILENDVSGKNLGEKVRVNLQDVSNTIGRPLRTENEIDKAIKALDSDINKRAKSWVAQNKSVLP
jgi:hypothetical protein